METFVHTHMCPVLGKPPPWSIPPRWIPPDQIPPDQIPPVNYHLAKFPLVNWPRRIPTWSNSLTLTLTQVGIHRGAIYRGGVWPGVIHRGAIYRGGIDQRGIFWTPMYPLLRCVAALHKAFIILILPGNHMEHYKLLPFQNSWQSKYKKCFKGSWKWFVLIRKSSTCN